MKNYISFAVKKLVKSILLVLPVLIISSDFLYAQYCTSESWTSEYDWISRVQMNTGPALDNETGGPPEEGAGYADFTELGTYNVTQGLTYDFTGTVDYDTGADPGQEFIHVYIDWNQNEDFTDAGEFYDIGVRIGGGDISNSIAVPAGATPGTTRMRVILAYYHAPLGPCEPPETYYWGETEDYTLNIIDASCMPTTQASNFSASAINVNDMTIQWERGDGDNVLVVARDSVAVSDDPVSGTDYAADPVYGSGDALGEGFVVYNGSGTSVSISGLTAGTTYHFAVYEYNTTDYCYLLPPLTGNETTDNDDASLSDLTVDGTTVDGFDAAIFTYDVELPYGTTVVPTVAGTPTDADANAVTTDAAGLPGASTVLVTAEDGTTTKTYTVSFTVAVAGIENLANEGISIYPNPSNGVFNVNVEDNFTLEIIDITGKIISTQILTGNSIVNINNSGVYFFRLSNEKRIVTQRVIVQ